MCVVSMIGDHFQQQFQGNPVIPQIISNPDAASKADLEELRKEVLQMKKLLERAVKYDKDNNEPNCEPVMFDLFGTRQRYEDEKERRESTRKLRDMAFETVLQSQDFARKIGVISTEEYYKWRLPFDMERYNIIPPL